MTIEELYELREQLLNNKTKFSELNAKYNKLLSKINEGKSKEKKLTEEEYIQGKASTWYWGRTFLMILLIACFKMTDDVILLFIFANMALRIVDEKVVLPKLWSKQKNKVIPESREEKNQRELYEEVSEARKLYHELNKKYETEFRKLSGDDKVAYLAYLESLGLSLDFEEQEELIQNVPSGDIKMLNMVYEEQ